MLQQLDEAEESWQEHAAEAPEGVGQLQVRVLAAAAAALCSRCAVLYVTPASAINVQHTG